jgi:CO/xanthine dehydrogenase FAD-binding subunit
MDLNTVVDVVRPHRRETLPAWRTGDAWLSGGTWLFSEPQIAVNRLIDLESMGWTPVEASDEGLRVASTCRIAELEAFPRRPEWPAASLITHCARSLLMSFKIWNMATVGGNVCMSLPAGAMISLITGLQGICVIWDKDGGERRVPIEQFVTGNHTNVLQTGELLRSIELPAAILKANTSFRQISLSPIGRSAALLIGTVNPADGAFALTVTASTLRPLRLEFAEVPTETALRNRITEQIPDSLYLDDVHGDPAYRKHINYLFAEEIRRELAGGVS